MPSGFDLNSCLQTNEGCEAFKQGACTIEEKYQIQHKTDTDKVSCQVSLFTKYIPSKVFVI